MTPDRPHPLEEIQDLLDERLAPSRRTEVAGHLERCPSCRREADALRSVMRGLRAGSSAPPALDLDLSSLLDAQNPSRRAWLLGAAAAVLLAVIGLWGARTFLAPAPDIASSLASDFRSLSTGRLVLTLPGTDTKVLERRFASDGIAFPTHVYDLGMMGFALAGGRVHEVAGRPSALFAYRSGTGRWLICQMYRGDEKGLPADAEVLEKKGIRFHVYQRDGVTVVFWEEGAIVCALASDNPSREVLELAIAKAMRV